MAVQNKEQSPGLLSGAMDSIHSALDDAGGYLSNKGSSISDAFHTSSHKNSDGFVARMAGHLGSAYDKGALALTSDEEIKNRDTFAANLPMPGDKNYGKSGVEIAAEDTVNRDFKEGKYGLPEKRTDKEKEEYDAQKKVDDFNAAKKKSEEVKKTIDGDIEERDKTRKAIAAKTLALAATGVGAYAAYKQNKENSKQSLLRGSHGGGGAHASVPQGGSQSNLLGSGGINRYLRPTFSSKSGIWK